MTLMNPKPYHSAKSPKTILICPMCRRGFTDVDGRGKRIYCKDCRAKKKYVHVLNYVHRKALVRKQQSAFKYFWSLPL